MKFLVTGAAGFIGSHVTRELIARGFRVLALVRPGSDLSRISDVLRNIDVMECDLKSPDTIQIPPVDVCIHLAWYCKPEDYRHSPVNSDWIGASIRLFMSLTEYGCKKIVAAGTCFEYAAGQGLLSESAAIDPLNAYAAAKHALHSSASKVIDIDRLDLVWARIFYLYGPYESPRRLVPFVTRELLRGERCAITSGSHVRDFLYVSDVASALVHAALSELSGPINIGSGIPVTVRDVAQTIGRMLGREELVVNGSELAPTEDSGFICADNAKLLQTRWSPQFDLETGLRSATAWWQSAEGMRLS